MSRSLAKSVNIIKADATSNLYYIAKKEETRSSRRIFETHQLYIKIKLKSKWKTNKPNIGTQRREIVLRYFIILDGRVADVSIFHK